MQVVAEVAECMCERNDGGTDHGKTARRKSNSRFDHYEQRSCSWRTSLVNSDWKGEQ